MLCNVSVPRKTHSPNLFLVAIFKIISNKHRDRGNAKNMGRAFASLLFDPLFNLLIQHKGLALLKSSLHFWFLSRVKGCVGKGSNSNNASVAF